MLYEESSEPSPSSSILVLVILGQDAAHPRPFRGAAAQMCRSVCGKGSQLTAVWRARTKRDTPTKRARRFPRGPPADNVRSAGSESDQAHFTAPDARRAFVAFRFFKGHFSSSCRHNKRRVSSACGEAISSGRVTIVLNARSGNLCGFPSMPLSCFQKASLKTNLEGKIKIIFKKFKK